MLKVYLGTLFSGQIFPAWIKCFEKQQSGADGHYAVDSLFPLHGYAGGAGEYSGRHGRYFDRRTRGIVLDVGLGLLRDGDGLYGVYAGTDL